MKNATSCIFCNKPLATRLGYQVEKTEWYSNPITGKKEQQVIVGLMCPVCNKKLSYRTSQDKLDKFLESIKSNKRQLDKS
jgi:hypothetical protein